MAAPTPAELANQMSVLITRWRTYTNQMKDWLAGLADGGPNSDGRYPLTDAFGNTFLILCPAAQEAAVMDTVDGTDASAVAAQAAQAAAESAAAAAQAAAATAGTYVLAVQEARDLALTYSNTAGTHAANAQTFKNQVVALAAQVQTNSDAATTAANATAADRIAVAADRVLAQQAAAAAQTFNPALYATVTSVDSKIAALVGASPTTLDTLNELATALGNDPHFATTVFTQLGLKVNTSDFTWANLGGKPTSLPPSAHTHAAADVTSGTFADARISQSSVTQWQSAFSIAWTQVTGKPSTFAPSAHTHAISEVTGLQAALDLKLDISAFVAQGFGSLAATPSDLNPLLSSPTSAFRVINTTSNLPSGLTFGAGMHLRYDGTGGCQFAISATSDRAWFRRASSSTWASWLELWHSGNFDPTQYTPVNTGANAQIGNSDLRWDFNIGGVTQFRIQNLIHRRVDAAGGGLTAMPRVFVQSTDPGTKAADGDLWIW